MEPKSSLFEKSRYPPDFAKSILFQSIFVVHFSTFFKLRFTTVSHTPPTTPKSSMLKASQRVRRPTSKAAQVIAGTADTSDNEVEVKQAPKTRRIYWSSPRTERLLDWLEENPEERQKLFSDSSKDAKDEGRRKHVAKSTKSEFHKMIAISVFSVDSDANVRNDCASNPVAYTKSVDNYLSRYVYLFI
jgi:hypothetical protein